MIAALIATLALATATPDLARPPVTAVGVRHRGVTAALQRSDSSLLAPFTLRIGYVNTGKAAQTMLFPTSDLVHITMRDSAGALAWDSLAHQHALPYGRTLVLQPGYTLLESVVVPALDSDGKALAPGAYTVAVELLSAVKTPAASLAVTLDAPQPIATALAAGRPSVTIAGIPSVTGGVPHLHDDSGEIVLSHALGIAPRGTYVVRGALLKTDTGTVLEIERYAPAHDNPFTPAHASP
jgi:hypothetical protein